MAELLIRVKDKRNQDDPIADRLCTKRGDVIVVCADGHPWSERERTSVDWRILMLPGIDPAYLADLVRPEIEDVQTAGVPPTRTVRARMYALDLEALPLAVRVWLDDDRPTRAASRSLVRTRLAVLAWVLRKTAATP